MISIVIPSVRNSTVTDAITAIIAQTDTDWELIISDQSKTDALVPVLNDFADSRIRRIECPGRGASLARNFGFLHARSDVIAFTDDDCRPRQNWVATIRELFKDPELWMATGILVAPPIKLAGLYAPSDYVPAERQARPSAGEERIYSVTANAIYRRIAFERAGPFDACLSPGTEFFGGEEDDHGRRMEMFDPLLMQTPRLEVEHTHGIRFGFKAVWDLRRKYAVSAGALAGKQTLLGEDGNQMARHETYLALSNVFRRSPMGTIRSASRAYFVWQGYRRALRGYGVDLKLRLLVPHGATLEELYGPTQTLLAYHLPERVEAESAAQAAGRK